MKAVLCVVLGALALSAVARATAADPGSTALLPLPVALQHDDGVLELTGRWDVRWSGCDASTLGRAFERFDDDYRNATGFLPHADSTSVAVEIRCAADGRSIDAMSNEGYSLVAGATGIRVDADGATGVLRALATLRQLVSMKTGKPALPYVTIRDNPRFAWRGVMLDTARHFIDTDTIARQIDAMERVKLNVLHLHLSDDQGFRVESRKLPRLNTVSSHGQFYTQDEIRHLVHYAAERGVLVVPEFDVPGHSRAMVEAYPDVGVTAATAQPPFPAEVALNPASERTYHFLETLIGEMASLFPGRYFHIGGDEVGDGVWQGNAQIDRWKQQEGLVSKRDVEHYFAKRVTRIVRQAGKTPIGWEEISSPELADDVIVQAWQSSNATASATAMGHRTIVSAGYYLDLLMPADFHYAFDPTSSSAAGFTPEEAERVRKLHPLLARMLPDAKIARALPPLTPEQERLILGGEAPLWGELVTDEMVDHRLWPRAAALAERFWSPSSVRDSADMYRRLEVIHDQLTIAGLRGDANRRRMAARLTPGNADPVHTLLDIVTPVRNMAHDHRILAAARGQRLVQPLNALADAAPADSLVAHAFIASVEQFIAGDATLESVLRSELSTWRDNDARFAAIAHGNAMLEPAVPTSASIAALARIGLDAIDALGGNGAAVSWEAAEKVLAQAEAHEEASRLPLASFVGKQPPADLIIGITPGIRALVTAARKSSEATARLTGAASTSSFRREPGIR